MINTDSYGRPKVKFREFHDGRCALEIEVGNNVINLWEFYNKEQAILFLIFLGLHDVAVLLKEIKEKS